MAYSWGALATSSANTNRSVGMAVRTHVVTTTRTHGFSSSTRLSVPLPGIMLLKMGMMRANRSGTPVRSLTK